jgi:hypothetical protein
MSGNTSLCAASACLLLAACQPLVLSLAGAGASAAVGHGLNGVTYRTFTAPLREVKQAALQALERMGIARESSDESVNGELIVARTDNRDIEIELEPISAKATRVRITAKNGGVFYDSSTATEIILQTEKLLEATSVTNSAAGGTKRVTAN